MCVGVDTLARVPVHTRPCMGGGGDSIYYQYEMICLRLPRLLCTPYTIDEFYNMTALGGESYENLDTTFNSGCLGSYIDEERCELRYVMRIARHNESSNF